MLRKPLQFENVNPNTTATLKFQGSSVWGNIINRIVMALGGTTFAKALMSGVRVLADGKIIVNSTGSRMDARMQYRGIAANAGFLTIDFNELRSKTIKGQMLGSIDTRLLNQLTIEIDIGAATAPTLSARIEAMSPADYDQLYSPGERALIGKCLKQTLSFSAAGEFAVPLPFGTQGGSLIRRIHYHGAVVTDARIVRDGLEEFNATEAYNTFIQGEYGRTAQADIFTVDFIKDGNQSNAFNAAAARSLENYVTVSGAGSVEMELELYDPLANN